MEVPVKIIGNKGVMAGGDTRRNVKKVRAFTKRSSRFCC
jgi:hypothetical protein